MVDWRNVNEASMYLQTNFKRKTKLANLLKEATRLQQETAKEFVDVVRFYFPKVEDVFARFGMADDITKAFCCEVYLEMLPCKTFADVLKKAGVDVSQKTHFTKEKFIYDGKFRHALDQLTLKVRRLNPHNKKHKQRIPVETILLAKEIWLMLEEERKQKGDGRVGEALGWMSRASRKRGFLPLNPPLRGLLLSQEQRTVRSGPGPRP